MKTYWEKNLSRLALGVLVFLITYLCDKFLFLLCRNKSYFYKVNFEKNARF